jgi:exodeoxyribonuclease-3
MKIATWNINSVRLRKQQVIRFLQEEAADIICLQEANEVIKNNNLD